MQGEWSFLHESIQYELDFKDGNVLRMEQGYLPKSCLTNCDEMLNFENGGGYPYSM